MGKKQARKFPRLVTAYERNGMYPAAMPFPARKMQYGGIVKDHLRNAWGLRYQVVNLNYKD
jgi:hypothetical protein